MVAAWYMYYLWNKNVTGMYPVKWYDDMFQSGYHVHSIHVNMIHHDYQNKPSIKVCWELIQDILRFFVGQILFMVIYRLCYEFISRVHRDSYRHY